MSKQRSVTALFVTLAPLAALSLRALLLACSDIAAVCCDSRIVRWQDGIAPYTISVRLAALAASLNCCDGDDPR